MNAPLSKKLLSVLLACAFFSPVLPAQAASTDAPTTITLEKTVQFEDPQGEDVLVPPGTYSVKAGEKEALQLIPKDATTPVTIQADQGSYKANMPVVSAASIPGQEGVLANTHLVILFLPDGHTLQAIGAYPGLQSRGIPDAGGGSGIQEPDNPTTIILDKPVHFLATDGSDVVAEPGNYSVESAQEWLRLIPGQKRRDALLIEAKADSHDVDLEIPMAMAIPGGTLQELNLLNVQLLLPGGNSLEAQGTYDGIRPRGWLSRAAAKAKARARAAALKAHKARVAAQARAKAIALAAKRAAEKAARAAAAKAKAIAAKTAKFAKIQGCKATVGLIKGGKAVAGFMKNVIPSIKSRKKGAQDRFKNDKNFRDRLIAKVTQNLQAHQGKIPELKKTATFMNQSKNKLDTIFSANNFCTDSVTTMDKKLMSLGMVPQFALVRSRGANDEHFYLGYQLSLGGGVGVGMQVGLMGVTDLRGNGGKYWFIGPQGITNATVGITAEIAFFPKVSLDSFKGWGSGVGISAGPPSKVVSGAVDVMLDEKVDKFQGFGFGPGVGVGVSPVDAAFSYTHSWKY
jgi:hypothetical protein